MPDKDKDKDEDKKESLTDHFKRHFQEIKDFAKTDVGKSAIVGITLTSFALGINHILAKRRRNE